MCCAFVAWTVTDARSVPLNLSLATLQRDKKIDQLLGALMEHVARNKPEKPVQCMIKILAGSSSVEAAVQTANQPTK